MEKQKVYVVFCHYWDGDDYTNDYIDSIWSDQEVAKKRVDDLANDYIRSEWYKQDCNPEFFECSSRWNDDKTSVTMSVDRYEETTYTVEVYDVDPCIADFEGP